jgi:hypothetical protein
MLEHNEEYAIQIARDWNTKDTENGAVDYVTSFTVPSDYLTRYPIQQVGISLCRNATAFRVIPAGDVAARVLAHRAASDYESLTTLGAQDQMPNAQNC